MVDAAPPVLANFDHANRMNFIYQEVPRGHQGPPNRLRSLPHPPKKSYVRFLNTSNVPVTVKWINFDGTPKVYRTVNPNQYFDCDTFVDHAWVFSDSRTGDPLCVDRNEIFWPRACMVAQNGVLVPKRYVVRIHKPVLPLLTLAARLVRDTLLDLTEPFFLEIPANLQTLLVKLKLDAWDALPGGRPNSPALVPDFPSYIILKSDHEDFRSNIVYISYRLSMHAKKLLSLARRRTSGERGYILTKTLEQLINALGYEFYYHNQPEVCTRKIASTIWKQMIFVRVYTDLLQKFCAPIDSRPEDNAYVYYDSLRERIERRYACMVDEHKTTVQRYHWEQLCLLLGKPEYKRPENDTDPAYLIPELIPLTERKEWEWISVRQKQLKDIFVKEEIYKYNFDLAIHLSNMSTKLENIFQVLCCFHFQLTGHHITEENPDEDEEMQELKRLETNI
ncbi:von Hippel-Lindau tumor suppressor-like protein [Frankliniella fusca]|uniref:von Hippel-Lindau tumor suppressor-like protein n=1 Tax=Frankliniella fusca TaxID=407009 RepID=A0AAE1LF20_9NEOP|nr:von Hippel-Lindau tumor suppressor-like protein [Frankliniella fusca]